MISDPGRTEVNNFDLGPCEVRTQTGHRHMLFIVHYIKLPYITLHHLCDDSEAKSDDSEAKPDGFI